MMGVDYIGWAEAALLRQDMSALQSLQVAINDPSQIFLLFAAAQHSNNLLFVLTQSLSKALLRGEFLPLLVGTPEEIEYERNRICSEIATLVLGIGHRHTGHIARSCLNAVSLCLKMLFDTSGNAVRMQEILQFLLPGLQFDERFVSGYTSELAILAPNPNSLPAAQPSHLFALRSVLQYASTSSYYTSYYDFRRNVYSFRNGYLPGYLYIATIYAKTLLLTNQHNSLLEQAISLLDAVFSFPFSLNLHQYEQDDLIQNIVTEVYFPNCFRHVLCDSSFLSSLLTHFCRLLLHPLTTVREQLVSLLKIFSKFVSASSYSFTYKTERSIARELSLRIVLSLTASLRVISPAQLPQYLADSYYLEILNDVAAKIIVTYVDADTFNDCHDPSAFEVFRAVMGLAEELITSGVLILQESSRTPFAKGFQLIKSCLEASKDYDFSNAILEMAKQALFKGFARLEQADECQSLLKGFAGQKGETDCFTDLFVAMSAVFTHFKEDSLALLSQLSLENKSRETQTVWLHLTAQIIPSSKASLLQTQICLRLLDCAKKYESLGSLRYTQALVEQVMMDLENGVPVTDFWLHIEGISGGSFVQFIEFIVNMCISNLAVAHEELIEQTLDMFRMLYSRLRKNNHPSFSRFYDIIRNLLLNLNKTVLAQSRFAKKRVTFFAVISVVWLSPGDISYLYDIYGIISASLHTNLTPPNLLLYIHDLTGLIEPIESRQPFQIIAELAVKDLTVSLSTLFPTVIELKAAFNQYKFLKAFLRLCLAFCNDVSRRITYDNHSALSVLISRFLHPYLKVILSLEGDLPKSINAILVKLPPLNPLTSLLPLPKEIRASKSSEEAQLVREYFQNLHRVEDIMAMQVHTEASVDYLVDWWEEIMNRGLIPEMDFRRVVNAHTCNTRRQSEALAKLLYRAGNYNEKYWPVKGYSSEADFTADYLGQH